MTERILTLLMLFPLSWSRCSSDRYGSIHYCRGICSTGEWDGFIDVSSPVQSSQSVHLVLQWLWSFLRTPTHHHKDPPCAHWWLHLYKSKLLPEHAVPENCYPDCLLWVWLWKKAFFLSLLPVSGFKSDYTCNVW